MLRQLKDQHSFKKAVHHLIMLFSISVHFY